MLVIRAEQMDVFKKTALQSFEDEMVEHLAQFSPPLYKVVGEEQMRKVIQLGMNQAAQYGFTFRGPVRLYLELMLLFGSYFDTDPQYPWAAEILIDRETDSQMQRAERLYEKTMDYRQEVAGPNGAYAIDPLKNALMSVRLPLPELAIDFSSAMLKLITYLYPQKANYVGKDGLEALIKKGLSGAQRQNFTTNRGTALVAGLMLTLGHKCAIDPLYPWIARILQDETIVDPAARAKRLETEAVTWIKQFLAYSDERGLV